MIRYIFILCICSIVTLLADAQEVDRDYWKDPDTREFTTIQQRMENFYADEDKGRGSGYKQWKRWEYFNQHRLDEQGRITNIAARNLQAMQEYGGNSRATHGSWTRVAPTNYVNGPSGYNPGHGRVNVIAFHPTIASTIYAGGPSGGLWRSTNTGTSWTALSDGIPSIGVSGIVVINTNIIYILTGDGDGADTYSVGVLKSTDAGQTWNKTGLEWGVTDNVRGYKLIRHPTNSNILMAATNTGLFRTTNGGISWIEEDTGSWKDVEYKPGDPNIVYLSGSSVKRSTDGGLNWTSITSGVPTGTNRIEIGVSPANANYVYLIAGPGGPASGEFKGVYRSFDSGLNFFLRADTPNILNSSVGGTGTSSQYTYDLAIAVDNNAVGTVITGGINVWKSTDFGVTFLIQSHWNTNTANSNGLAYTHADIHELVYNPLDGSLYCGSDGGIYRSTNDGVNWTDLTSGMTIMQWYKIAGTPQNSSRIIGGTQDNGSNEWDGGSTVDHMYGADGMDCMIDHSNQNIYYFSSQNGGLRKSTDSGNTSSSIKPAGASGSWVTPYVMNPSNSSIIYAGYSDIYKSTNGGSTWSVSTTFSGSGCLAHGTNNTNRVYASSGSQIYMTNNGGSTWTNVTGNLPSQTITGITINPDNSPEVIVTLSGFTAGQKVYRSTGAGTTWTNISGSLPNVPMNCIAFEDNNASPDDAIYVGSDIGVFYRDAVLGDWTLFSNWLPTVPIFDLEIHQSSNRIRAGTYGRGLWTSTTFTPCPTQWTLSGTQGGGVFLYEASDSITSTRYMPGSVGNSVFFRAGNKIRLKQGFRAQGGIDIFHAATGPCGVGIPTGPNQVQDSIGQTHLAGQQLSSGEVGLVMDKEENPTRFAWNDNQEDVLMTIVSTSGSAFSYEETFTKGNTDLPARTIDLEPGSYLVEVKGSAGAEQLRFRITE